MNIICWVFGCKQSDIGMLMDEIKKEAVNSEDLKKSAPRCYRCENIINKG